MVHKGCPIPCARSGPLIGAAAPTAARPSGTCRRVYRLHDPWGCFPFTVTPRPTYGATWVGAETVATMDRYVRRAVAYSERDWTELGTMAEISSNAPGSLGVHGSYSVVFRTVNRHGREPIEGHIQADSFYGYVSSTVDHGQGRQPCPGTAMIDPETHWVTFAISKACFPDRQRVISGYVTKTGAFLYVETSDGVVADTEDYAVDQTARRRQDPIWIRQQSSRVRAISDLAPFTKSTARYLRRHVAQYQPTRWECSHAPWGLP